MHKINRDKTEMPWQLDAEMLSVIPGEAALAVPLSLLGVHAVSKRLTAKPTLNAIVALCLFFLVNVKILLGCLSVRENRF